MRAAPGLFSRPRRWLAALAPLLAAAVFGLPLYGYIAERNRLYDDEQRAMIAKEVALHADALQRHIDRCLSIPAVLAAIVKQRGGLRDFEAIAAEVMRGAPAVAALHLAPGGIITASYPLQGSEKMIGGELFAGPRQREDVSSTVRDRRLTVIAPVDLAQGGRALVARAPVFVLQRDGERFWGFVVATLRIVDPDGAPLLAPRFTENFHFTLSHLTPGVTEERLIHRTGAEPLGSPLIHPVRLNSGDILVLRAEPRTGWPRRPGLSLELALLAVAALLLAGLTHQLVRRPIALGREVETRTAELRTAKEQLECEAADRRQTHAALRESEAFLDSVIENLPSMIFVKDAAALRFVRVNRAAETLLGHGREALIGATDHDFFPPAQAHFFTARDREVLESAALLDIACEEIDTRANGRRLLHTRKIPIPGRDGKPAYLLGISEDITAQREAEHRLRLAGHVFEHSSEGILVTDSDCLIVLVNRAFEATTGYPAAEAIGQTPRLLRSGAHGPDFYRAMWESLAANGEWHGEIINRRRNGEHYPEWLTITVVKDDRDQVTNYVAVFSDLTSRKEVESRLNFLAYHDVLTGLPNRALFTDRLEQAISQAQRSGSNVGVMCLDLDRFKRVNETLGHRAGDGLLRAVSQRLRACVRRGDSVCRLGGDAFGIVLNGLSKPHDAAIVAEKVLRELAAPIALDGAEVVMSASIGISVYPEDGRDGGTLVKNSDSAMYQAAFSGRGRYRFYTADMNSRSAERLVLEGELRHALERGELDLHYQPLVSARDGRIVGAEALLRWHRHGGTVSPAAFIPLLEETGLIVSVGEWVLRTACGHRETWNLAGHADLVCTVNFSVQQFLHRDVLAMIRAVLNEAAVPPGTIELELTESMLMRDPDDSAARMKAIKDMGLRLAIDDFGTGYSSLSYLRRFPIDTLKIDRSFVQDAPGDPNACAIVEAIVGISRSLKLGTVAEGVETPDQAAFLRRGRCDILQGFHFAQPMPHADFVALLDRERAGAPS